MAERDGRELGGRVGGRVGRTRQNVSIFIGTFQFSGSGSSRCKRGGGVWFTRPGTRHIVGGWELEDGGRRAGVVARGFWASSGVLTDELSDWSFWHWLCSADRDLNY